MLYTSTFFTAFILALVSPSTWGFQHCCSVITAARPRAVVGITSTTTTTTTSLRYTNMDAFETRDAMELLIGGARYEMVELPDSMMSTTLWVGNLCEFVTDEMLSEVFQQASEQLFVPACVARKPNMESLKYGFVAFRSEEEKEVSSYYILCCVYLADFTRSIFCSHLICTMLQYLTTSRWPLIYLMATKSTVSHSKLNPSKIMRNMAEFASQER